LLVFDHLTRGVALLHDGSEAERQSLRREVIQALRGAVPAHRSRRPFLAGDVPSLTEAAHAAACGARRSTSPPATSINWCWRRASRAATRSAPFEVYRALRLLNPSPYMYFCELGDITVVGSSPEALGQVHGGHAQLRPIAGSRPRGADAARDAALEAELLADPKENAEHVMLVDLARNDLGRVATAGLGGGRSLPRDRALQPHHAHRQRRQWQLGPGSGCLRFVRGDLSRRHLGGAPKVRAMEIIDELEPVGRQLYGGTVGYFGRRGDMDQAITIRTLVFRGDTYSYQAGGGIVADSVAAGRIRGADGEERGAAQRARTGGGGSVSMRPKDTADRQLRFLHLQPGAGVPGAGRRGRRASQRRHQRRGGACARPTHLVISPGPGTPRDAGSRCA
jgi:anthranilate synthase component 1